MRTERLTSIQTDINPERMFVGRQKELQILYDLATAYRNTSAILYLSRAPGIGKSALIEEFARQNSNNPVLLVRHYAFGQEEEKSRVSNFINFICEQSLSRNQIIGLTDRDRSELVF